MEVFQITIACAAQHFMATTRLMPQDGALLTHRPNAGVGGQPKKLQPPEGIVALPESATTTELASAVMAPLARNFETLTVSKSS
jgi:hypothetical protein